ncbi:MAG: FAD-dependent oxidoreductase [bacterium]
MYQLLIIGAGPAGLSASIYASRYHLKHLVIGKEIGGLANSAHVIENWPGNKQTSGAELMKSFREHAESLGGEILNDQIAEIKKINGGFLVKTVGGQELTAQSLILAMGTEHRPLAVPGEKELLGKGVSYCAICDGPLFKGKTVAVAGGSDCAAITATFLADFCGKVYIIYRNGQMRCEPIWQERLKQNRKIEIITDANIKEIKGVDKVVGLILDNGREIALDGLFIEIGSAPNVKELTELGVALIEEDYIKIDESGATSVPGVYAAGDITSGSNKLRQVITSSAEGVVAAVSAAKYLKES